MTQMKKVTEIDRGMIVKPRDFESPEEDGGEVVRGVTTETTVTVHYANGVQERYTDLETEIEVIKA